MTLPQEHFFEISYCKDFLAISQLPQIENLWLICRKLNFYWELGGSIFLTCPYTKAAEHRIFAPFLKDKANALETLLPSSAANPVCPCSRPSAEGLRENDLLLQPRCAHFGLELGQATLC